MDSDNLTPGPHPANDNTAKTLEQLKAEALERAREKRDAAKAQACQVLPVPQKPSLRGPTGSGFDGRPFGQRPRGIIQETRFRLWQILAGISGEEYYVTADHINEAWEEFRIFNPELAELFVAAVQDQQSLEQALSPSGHYN